MPAAAPRSRLAFLLLAAALLLVAAAVVATLVLLHDAVLAGIIAVAGVAGVLGGGFAYAVARESEADGELGVLEAEADALSAAVVMPIAVPRAPMRIQSLPVADLPPAYLAAVMKGVRAHGAKQQARVLPEVQLRQ